MAVDKLAILSALSGIGQGYLAVQKQKKEEALQERMLTQKKAEADRDYALKKLQQEATQKYYEGRLEADREKDIKRAVLDQLSAESKAKKAMIDGHFNNSKLETEQLKLGKKKLERELEAIADRDGDTSSDEYLAKASKLAEIDKSILGKEFYLNGFAQARNKFGDSAPLEMLHEFAQKRVGLNSLGVTAEEAKGYDIPDLLGPLDTQKTKISERSNMLFDSITRKETEKVQNRGVGSDEKPAEKKKQAKQPSWLDIMSQSPNYSFSGLELMP